MKIMVIGHARHGKDTVCELLKEHYGLSFTSSSMFACELFIYNLLKDTHGYSTIEECFNDRVNHRPVWHQLIKEYQGDDKTLLTKAIFSKHDVYCGNRSREEVRAAVDAGLVDCVIWVDASKRLPPEGRNSMSLTKQDADYIIDNNGTEEELVKRIVDVMSDAHVDYYFTNSVEE